ncbi:hypothetical protein KKF91_10155 [Myxococcota bacterium]|nr:hypothetical protein [Myxococcota bacterium]
MRAALLTLLVASAMIWIAVKEITARNLAIRLGFEISRLESVHRELLDEHQKRLIIREALISPSRITPIAAEAGLRTPSPDAVEVIHLSPQGAPADVPAAPR